MTNLYERVIHLIEYFQKNRGKVPLCCVKTKKVSFGKIILYYCDAIGKWLPERKFHRSCLSCQERIAYKLGIKNELLG